MAAAPCLLRATQLVLLTEFMSMLVLAIMWNLLAGYADIVTVGQHAFVGVGAYAFFGFAALAGLESLSGDPARRLRRVHRRGSGNALVFRLRTAYLADRHLGGGRSADAGRGQARRLRRRLRRKRPDLDPARLRHARRGAAADDLLACLRARGSRACWRPIFCCARASASA